MDVIARLPDCARQAAATISDDHVNAGRFNIIETSQVRMSRNLDTTA